LNQEKKPDSTKKRAIRKKKKKRTKRQKMINKLEGRKQTLTSNLSKSPSTLDKNKRRRRGGKKIRGVRG